MLKLAGSVTSRWTDRFTNKGAPRRFVVITGEKVDWDGQELPMTPVQGMSIGQLAQQTGESVKAIRYWTDLGLLTCTRRPSGYRSYSPGGTSEVQFIRSAQAAGFSLDAIHKIHQIRQSGQPPCEHVREELETHLRDVRAHIAQLQQLEAQLEAKVAWADENPELPCDGAGCVYLDRSPGA
jgi:DNA-binding transcriptional MerR regulator